jgi:acetyltransferase
VTPQTSTEIPETAEVVVAIEERTEKPILGVFMGGTLMQEGIDILMGNEVPNYPFPERAVAAFKAMADYAAWRKLPKEEPRVFDVDKDVVAAAFAKTRAEGRTSLNEVECAAILEAYGFPIPKSKLCTSADDAVAYATSIGFPVVMKIASPDILHKSDVGGVKVGLTTPDTVRDAYDAMMYRIKGKMPEADIWGVNIQQMVTTGKQTILGMSRDPQFGPMLMFGLGGIYVEVLKDVTFRIAPLTERDARQMISEIRSYKLLTGVRGEKSVDIEAIVESLLRLSQLVTDFPEIAEMDINPLVALPDGEGAVSIDSRIALTK